MKEKNGIQRKIEGSKIEKKRKLLNKETKQYK